MYGHAHLLTTQPPCPCGGVATVRYDDGHMCARCALTMEQSQ